MKQSVKSKTRHLLYILLAVVLCLANVFFVWMAAPQIDKHLSDGYAPFVAVGCILFIALNSVAVWKHYR